MRTPQARMFHDFELNPLVRNILTGRDIIYRRLKLMAIAQQQEDRSTLRGGSFLKYSIFSD